jgi:hypothetical protein
MDSTIVDEAVDLLARLPVEDRIGCRCRLFVVGMGWEMGFVGGDV